MEPLLQLLRRWAWLPLTLCILVLGVALWNTHAETESLAREWQRLNLDLAGAGTAHHATASTKPAAIDAGTTAAAMRSDRSSASSPEKPGAKPKLPPGVLAMVSDTNALGDPNYAATIARRQRRYAMGNNRRAIDALHLAPAEAARLKELLAERWLNNADTADILARMSNVSPDLRVKAVAAAKAGVDAKIEALLGPERYAAFQTENAVSATQQTNWALFTDFWDAGVPLSADQQAALARAMVDTGVSPWKTGRPPADPAAANEALLTAATGFLSPEQVAFLRASQAADARYQRAAHPKPAAVTKEPGQ